MRYPTIEELFDSFEIDSDDYNSEDEALIALNEEVAAWASDNFDAHPDDVLNIIKDYGISETVHNFENNSVCHGMYSSIENFWENFILDVDEELNEAIQSLLRNGFLFPQVDTIAVEQSYSRYDNGTVICTDWE